MIYYAIALAYDFMPAQWLGKMKDYIFASLALPLALLTTLMYWSMKSINRELVFPKALDAFFPFWLDYTLHTNVSVLIIADLLYNHHQYPKRSAAIRGLVLFMLSYLIWLYVIFMNTGKWVYGIIGIFSAPQRIIFFAVLGLVAISLYFVGEILNKVRTVRNNVKKKMK